MRTHLILFALVLTGGAAAQTDTAALYHPFHTGDEWIYRRVNSYGPFTGPFTTTHGFTLARAERDTLIDGIPWVIISLKEMAAGYTASMVQRYDTASGRLLQRYPVRNSEVLDSVPCTTLNATFGRSMQLTGLRNDRLLGHPTVVRTVRELVTGSFHTMSYARGLGLVEELYQDQLEGSGSSTSRLVHARIGGVTYGRYIDPAVLDSLLQYRPLHTGNVWVYATDSAAIVESVRALRDTSVAGLRFTLLNRTRHDLAAGTMSPLETLLERVDTLSWSVYRVSGGQFVKTDSLFLTQGDSVKLGGVPMSVTTGADTVFGTVRPTRTVTVSLPPHKETHTEAYGIGCIRRTTTMSMDEYPFSVLSTTNRTLLYAKVNGVEYGTAPLSVPPDGPLPPFSFALHQNHPNPFNPSTSISFTVGRTGETELTVFDMLGRVVAVPFLGMASDGVYTVRFDAASLASGVYFYRLRSGDFSQTRRMMLVR
ncbi:MAG: T9SS type A sorting domain-containing protein [Bacteroidetes bacterium]|nr:MAG: T9SS type A sorting domain-containing protein [Bacteroidota bacterium]